MPDLRELRVIVAVAAYPSFSAAARALGITQQAVSRVVANLEAELDVILVVRSTRATELTPAGRLLAERGREVLRLADQLTAEVRRIGTGEEGAIRVGVSHEVGEADRTAVVSAICAGLEGASVSLHQTGDEELPRALAAREVDIGVVFNHGFDDPRVMSVPLRSTPMAVYVLSHHRLADAGRAALEAFAGDSLMICKAPGDPYVDCQMAAFSEAGIALTASRGRVSGSMTQALTHLTGPTEVALMPAGTPTPSGVREIQVADVSFPLQLIWSTGWATPAVHAVRAQLGRR